MKTENRKYVDQAIIAALAILLIGMGVGVVIGNLWPIGVKPAQVVVIHTNEKPGGITGDGLFYYMQCFPPCEYPEIEPYIRNAMTIQGRAMPIINFDGTQWYLDRSTFKSEEY